LIDFFIQKDLQDVGIELLSFALPHLKEVLVGVRSTRAVAQIILAMVLGLRYKDGKDNN